MEKDRKLVFNDTEFHFCKMKRWMVVIVSNNMNVLDATRTVHLKWLDGSQKAVKSRIKRENLP